MARPKRIEGAESAARPAGILAEVPTIARLKCRLHELQTETARVARLLDCLQSMEETDEVVDIADVL